MRRCVTCFALVVAFLSGGCAQPESSDAPEAAKKALPFEPVVEYLNANMPDDFDYHLDPGDESNAGKNSWIATVCGEVDGESPSKAMRVAFQKGLTDATPEQAKTVFETLVEGCYVTNKSSRPAGPWVFDAQLYEASDVMTMLHDKGHDEFIRALVDPDEYVEDLCGSVSDADPDSVRSTKSEAVESLADADYGVAFGESKVADAVSAAVRACFATKRSTRWVPPPTLAEQNATDKAIEYLDYSGFSRIGLVRQLKYEGFARADAEYGADHAGADWMDEAAEKAEEYMDYSSFSRSGLIQQLRYEGFTQRQAEHGARKVGY